MQIGNGGAQPMTQILFGLKTLLWLLKPAANSRLHVCHFVARFMNGFTKKTLGGSLGIGIRRRCINILRIPPMR